MFGFFIRSANDPSTSTRTRRGALRKVMLHLEQLEERLTPTTHAGGSFLDTFDNTLLETNVPAIHGAEAATESCTETGDESQLDSGDCHRVIFDGSDERERVRDTTSSAAGGLLAKVGLVEVQLNNGGRSTGTGVLVGDRYVLTSAHVLLPRGRRSGAPRPRAIRFFPGLNGANTAPYGSVSASRFDVFAGWMTDPGEENAYNSKGQPIDPRDDIGIIKLSANPNRGYFGMSAWSTSQFNDVGNLNSLGYPCDLSDGYGQYHQYNTVNFAEDEVVYTVHDSAARQSGSPLFAYYSSNERHYALGILHGTNVDPQTNRGWTLYTRITSGKFNAIQDYIQNGGPSSGGSGGGRGIVGGTGGSSTNLGTPTSGPITDTGGDPPNTAPVAFAESYTVNAGATLTVPARGVLTNDYDAEGNLLTARRVFSPSHGSLTLNTNGGFTYTPSPGYTGFDQFGYVANDGSSDSNTATVTIQVVPTSGGGGGGGTGNTYPELVSRTSTGQWWISQNNGSLVDFDYFGSWVEGADWQDVGTGDFNGDGLTDVVGRTSAGQWWVGLNSGSRFNFSLFGSWSASADWRDVHVVDFNGDGRSDIVGRAFTGQWWAALSDGSQFSNTFLGVWAESAGWRDVLPGDFNNDGRTDLIGRTSTGDWWLATSTGTQISSQRVANWRESAGWHDVQTGDFDADGRLDLIGRTSAGQWWIGANRGSTFQEIFFGAWAGSAGWRDVLVGDVAGDSRVDVIGRTATGQWWVGVNTANGFNNVLYGAWSGAINWLDVQVGNFAGTDRADVIGRTPDGIWWIGENTGTGLQNRIFGQWGNVPWVFASAGNFLGTGGSSTMSTVGVEETSSLAGVQASFVLTSLESGYLNPGTAPTEALPEYQHLTELEDNRLTLPEREPSVGEPGGQKEEPRGDDPLTSEIPVDVLDALFSDIL